jgi:hypothetical protein
MKTRGYALLEVLVALTITLLSVAALLGWLGLTGRYSQKLQVRGSTATQLLGLERVLRGLVVHPVISEIPVLSGDPTHLRVRTKGFPVLGHTQAVDFEIRFDALEKSLVLIGQDRAQRPFREKIMTDVERVAFSYQNKKEELWQSLWSEDVRLLHQIRVELTLKGQTETMRVPVEAVAPRACALDPFTPVCQSVFNNLWGTSINLFAHSTFFDSLV